MSQPNGNETPYTAAVRMIRHVFGINQHDAARIGLSRYGTGDVSRTEISVPEGWVLMPATIPDDDFRSAVHRAQVNHVNTTKGFDRSDEVLEEVVAKHLANPQQRGLDEAAYAAMIAEGQRRLSAYLRSRADQQETDHE